MKFRKIQVIILSVALVGSLAACTAAQDETTSTTQTNTSGSTSISIVETSVLDKSDLFTVRDLEQTADLSSAVSIELVSGKDVTITEEGVYVLSGNVENTTVIVEADDEAKVQLVIDGVSIVNDDAPAIYIKSGDKIFITTTTTENHLEVSGLYEADGDINLDAVIFSKSDLVLNGTGKLEIVSNNGNGISSKDDLKITGGKYLITSSEDAIEANDSIRIYDGEITISTEKDAIHSENSEDSSLGYVYISGGTIKINASDDGIYGNSVVQIDNGEIIISSSREGIEGTYVQINGGNIDIYASDDGINAANKTNSTVAVVINGGTVNVEVGSGDTDAVDSNGSLSINGGTINITAPTSSFDADGTAQLNGGDVTVNGQKITQITLSMPMGGGRPMR